MHTCKKKTTTIHDEEIPNSNPLNSERNYSFKYNIKPKENLSITKFHLLPFFLEILYCLLFPDKLFNVAKKEEKPEIYLMT